MRSMFYSCSLPLPSCTVKPTTLLKWPPDICCTEISLSIAEGHLVRTRASTRDLNISNGSWSNTSVEFPDDSSSDDIDTEEEDDDVDVDESDIAAVFLAAAQGMDFQH
jgi:hypothetical protein